MLWVRSRQQVITIIQLTLDQLKLSSNAMEMKFETAETDKEVLETELLEMKMAKEELESRLLDTQVRLIKF